MSHERLTSPEQRHPRWEMDMTWNDMLVAMLERKVIAATDPGEPLDETQNQVVRRFKTPDGGYVSVWGWQFEGGDEGRPVDSMWTFGITRPSGGASGREPELQTSYYTVDNWSHDPYINYEGYQVVEARTGNRTPLSPTVVESIVGTIATMTPITETEYTNDPDAYLLGRDPISRPIPGEQS
jgi:hypothetical protein